MAKFSANGSVKVASAESVNGRVRYTLCSDGRILRQVRIFDKLEAPTLHTKFRKGVEASAANFYKWALRYRVDFAVDPNTGRVIGQIVEDGRLG